MNKPVQRVRRPCPVAATIFTHGPPSVDEKVKFLLELELIVQMVNLPWIINGDFNLVRGEGERSSGRADRRMVSKFRHTINRLGLHDMPLVGVTQGESSFQMAATGQMTST